VAAAEQVAEPPRIWLVLGDKLGDNAQVEIVARELGLPAERKALTFKAEYVFGKPPFKASLHHIDLAASSPLAPPWPDLVLTVGRRPAMAAFWIRQQSGGATRVVLFGRPKKAIADFDLVIAPGQYSLPDDPRVLPLALPLMQADPAAVAAAGERWRERLEALPRPLTAVLVGGPTKPFRFDAGVVDDLLARLRESTQGQGSLFVTTSRRTPAAVAERLQAGLPASAAFYRWQAGAPAEDNPYLGLLALADRFVVTGDSISMLVEVSRLGRPLAIFRLPEERRLSTRLRRALVTTTGKLAAGGGVVGRMTQKLQRAGLFGYQRDFDRLHNHLLAQGAAVELGRPFPQAPARLPDEVAGVVAAVRRLLPPEDAAGRPEPGGSTARGLRPPGGATRGLRPPGGVA